MADLPGQQGMTRRGALGLLAFGPALHDVRPQPLVTVTYLANYGAVLRAGGEAVVIDGLFRDGIPPYRRVPAADLIKLETAAAPFSDVAAILVSHQHRDHFDASSVAALLNSNERAQLWSSPQVCGAVLGVLARPQNQVQHDMPKVGEKICQSFGNIEVTMFRVEHGKGREDIQNLGHIIRLNGKSFLHVGDAAEPFDHLEAAALADEKIDVAMLPWWLLLNSDANRILRAQIRPRTVIAMHVSEEDEVKGIPRIRRAWPDLRVALRPMETFSF